MKGLMLGGPDVRRLTERRVFGVVASVSSPLSSVAKRRSRVQAAASCGSFPPEWTPGRFR